MGAQFQQAKMPGNIDRKIIEARFRDMQEQDRYENGHSYSGGWGMATGLEFRRETFETLSDAYEWLGEHAEKWGPALAIRAKDGRETLRATTLPTPNPNFGKEFWVMGAWCSS